MPMPMLKISNILIGVSDLNNARPFYEKAFGFVFDEFRPPFASATFDEIEFNIEENADYRSPDWAAKNIGGRKNISFFTEDLEKFLTEAQSHGATLVEPISEKPWGYKEAVIADLDGNEFLIEQEI